MEFFNVLIAWIVCFFFLMTVLAVIVGAIGNAGRKRRIWEAGQWNPAQVQGSARCSTLADLIRAGLFKANGICIGFYGLKRLYYNGPGHLLLVAGARAGKAVTILVQAILTLPKRYSLLVFDPKGELCAICAHYLSRRGPVYVLNPFGILLDAMKGLKQAKFNPMSSLDPNSIDFHAACDKLADAICWVEHTTESHFIDSARLLISGIIAALVKYGAPEDKNLVAVRNVITGATGRTVYQFCRECMALPDPYIRQKLAIFTAKGAEENKELNCVVSTANTQTGFIGNEAIAESLKGDDFRFADLKRRPSTTVFVCLPLDKLDVTSKYFRVLAATGISDILKEGLRGPGAPALAILDEVAQIGPLKILSDAWAMAAGAAGLQLLAVYQDVSQITNQFKTVWQTMVQNSGAAMYFGIRDHASAEFVSKQTGVAEVISHSRNVSIDQRTGEPVVSDGATQTSRPLFHPDEVRFRVGSDSMLLFTDGLPGVAWVNRRLYVECADLRGKYRDNPYFQKPRGGFLSWLFE